MKNFPFKVNKFLIVGIIFMLFVIVFIDSNVLNSMFITYNDNFTIEEVDVSTYNKDTNIKEEVIVRDEEIVDSYVTMLNAIEDNKWVWPTDSNYVITSYYGYRWGRMHDAIDISGPGYGSNIYAANNGVVVTARGGCTPGYSDCNGRAGNYVIIKHNKDNYYTIYMHLKSISVSVGNSVSRGQIIGTMGNTGNVIPVPTSSNPYAGTHLHFGLYIGEPYRGGYAVDPMRLY